MDRHQETVLVFDLGTTYFKAVLFDQTGAVQALERLPVPATKPQQGWLEIEAGAFRKAIIELCKALARQAADAFQKVQAVTFATQTNSFLLLDDQGEPLTPIILWPDTRAIEYEAYVAELSGIPGLYKTTGVPAFSHQFMVSKLLWLQRHDTSIWSKCAHVMLVSDYLTYLFTGRFVTEAGAAGLTGLIHIHTLKWWPEMLQSVNLTTCCLPEILRAGMDLGDIQSQIAQALGLSESCHFVMGCLDQFAGAIGAGNVKPGGLSETTGTVLATVRCTEHFQEKASVFQGPGPTQDIYYAMDFGDISACLLEAYRNSLPDHPDFDTLVEAAVLIPPGAEGVRLKNGGEHLPILDAFDGWSAHCQRGHAVRAILEAVAFDLKRQVHQLCEGEKPREVRSVGGAARSKHWLQIKASVLGCPVVATTCPEPTSLGAAILAFHALHGETIEALAEYLVNTCAPIYPEPKEQGYYASAYHRPY